ncbi:uncharacterized protein LOC115225308 [Argonauta hians]
MNALLIQSLLLDRYNTHFLGLVRKLSLPFVDIFPAHSMKERQGRYIELPAKPCSYPNNIATSRSSSTTAKSSSNHIKLRIQNAINKAMQGEKEDSGVFFGGRRRNRRRRPNKNKPSTQKKSKKNNDKKKKEKNEENRRRVAVEADNDQSPLIDNEWPEPEEEEENQVVDDREDSGVWTVDTEAEDNGEVDTMPFFKKKSAPKPAKEESPVTTPTPTPTPAAETPVEPKEPTPKAKVEEEEPPVADNGRPTAATTTPATTPVASEAKTEPTPAVTPQDEDNSAKETVAIDKDAGKPDAVDGGTVADPLPATTQVDFIEDDLMSVASSVDIFNIEDRLNDFKVSDEAEEEAKLEPKPKTEEKAAVTSTTTTGGEGVVLVESSPLITKESKIRDNQPGLLCCTII